MFTTGEIEPYSVWDMVSKVMKKAGGNKIRTLQIHGHGCPGVQGVAYSTSLDGTGNRALVTDTAGNLVGQGQYLSHLAPYFMPNARIHLGGCHVAKGADGERLLRAVSRAASRTGNTVFALASESWQNPWWPGYESWWGGKVRWSEGTNVFYTSMTSMS
jgi:hypothetical protein